MSYDRKVYGITGDRQKQMLRNGWWMELRADGNESIDDLYERCLRYGYKTVRIYSSTTMIRGLHSYYAMCKN